MPRSDGRKALPPEGRDTPRSITPRLPDSCGKPQSTPGAHGTQRLRPRAASATSTIAAIVEPTSTRGCAEATTPGVGDATTAGRIRALRTNHLIRKLSARPYDGRRSRPGSGPLYRLLRKTERFTWTPEAEEALGNLKALLTSAPILVPPAAGEALLIYVAATTQVVSAAIVVKRREEGHALPVQRPVYFISEVLSETKIRYPQIQKLLYVVILTRRKLRHYFESHSVTVVSSFPLGEIIQCREASGRIAKRAVEIMGETISFAPRKAIKSQVLADFVAEWVDTQLPTAPIQPELWTMFFDGSLMKTGAGAGLLFISPLGKRLRYVLHLHFPASNNVAEYEVLVNGLRIAIELGVRRLDARGDLQLVINQVMKNSHYHDPKMEAYCDEVRCLEDKFYGSSSTTSLDDTTRLQTSWLR
jgi:ribonuclease HI